MEGEYIAQRLLPELVAQQCRQLGIQCMAFSDSWLLRLSKGDQSKWVIGYHFDVNASAASLIAKDKVAAFLALSSQDVPAIPHYLVKSAGSPVVPFADISSLPENSSYVAKPLHGTGGRDISRHQSVTQTIEAIRTRPGEWAISPYVKIIREKRCVVLDNEILCSYVKMTPQTTGEVLFYNLGHGAIPVDEPASQRESALALQATRACGLRLASVDIVTLDTGEQLVLEVNAGIMMEHYARLSEDNYQRANKIYGAIVRSMFPV